MMAGNFITKMFDKTSKQFDFDNSMMKFLIQADYDTIAKTIESYMVSVTKDPNYTYTGNGVVYYN